MAALAFGVRALGVGGFPDFGEAAFGEAGWTDPCICESLGVMVLPWMALSATSFFRSAGGATTFPTGLSRWAICVRVFFPDLVRALAAGASDRGVWNRSANPDRSAALCFLFLPDLGVFISLFTPLGLMLLRTFRALLDEGLAAFLAEEVLGVFLALFDLGVFRLLVWDNCGVLTLGVVFGGLPRGVVFRALEVSLCCGLASPPAAGCAIPAERGVDVAALFGVFIGLSLPLGVRPTAAAAWEGLGVFIRRLRPTVLGVVDLTDFGSLGVLTSLASPEGLGVAAAALEGFGVFISREIPRGLGLGALVTALGVFISLATPEGLAAAAFSLGVLASRFSPTGLGVTASTRCRFAGGASPVSAAGDAALALTTDAGDLAGVFLDADAGVPGAAVFVAGLLAGDPGYALFAAERPLLGVLGL